MNNFDTVREALKLGGAATNAEIRQAITALDQIEADHYSAADMADAQAKAFREGVASVQQGEPFAHFVYFPDQQHGEFTHDLDELCEDMTNDENHQVTALYTAAPVAQQPQARPDFTDEWTGYLKDGETPFERFLRERKDLNALTKLYQRALEENERLTAKQPQAELLKSLEDLLESAEWLTAGCDEESLSDDVCRAMQRARATIAKTTVNPAPQQTEAVPADFRDRLVAISQAIADQDDRAAQAMIREILAAPQQAEVTKTVATHDDTDLIEQMLEALRSCSGVPHWPALIPTINAARKRLETPQQAEAVPPDVVQDAERYRWLRDQTTDDGIAIVMKNKCINDSISYAENINKHIDAAIAAQGAKT